MKKTLSITALTFGLAFLLASCAGSSHTMEDGSDMEGTSHESSAEHTEGDSHAMEDGTTMSGKTHEESGSRTEGDSHAMEDGSTMEGATHAEGAMDDGTESQ